VAGYLEQLDLPARAMLDQVLSCSAIGSPGTVAAQLKAFIERTGADELMITSQVFDHAARLRSYEITADIRRAG
jgi:alkanesulfonate monooxygenase SsuD/methylene tetrahydromethanopterin reductase-like flavin-dependent oxidoreductase (luciferase family)